MLHDAVSYHEDSLLFEATLTLSLLPDPRLDRASLSFPLPYRADHTVSSTAMKYWSKALKSKGCGTLGLDKVPMTGYFQDRETEREYFKVHTNMKCFNSLKADTELFYDEVEVLPSSIKACPSVLAGYSGKEQEEVG